MERRWKRRSRFMPKKTADLRLGMAEHIGKVFDFDYAWTAEEGENYAGQATWIFARHHDNELGDENAARWVPDEDLEDVDTD